MAQRIRVARIGLLWLCCVTLLINSTEAVGAGWSRFGTADPLASEPSLQPVPKLVSPTAHAEENALYPEPPTSAQPDKIYRFKKIAEYPSDISAFVQGLTVDNGTLVMSTGLWGSSSLRKIHVETGEIIQKADDKKDIFGEGIAVLKDRIYQLTYRNNFALVFDKNSLQLVAKLRYPKQIAEGWGLTANPETNQLYATDGSSEIFVLSPNFEVVQTLTVHEPSGRTIIALNELEWVEGEIWANIYASDCVVRISPVDGLVLGYIVSENFYPDNPYPGLNVFNGIAYDPSSKRIFVTGKDWPKVLEVTIEKAPDLRGSLTMCSLHQMDVKSMFRASVLLSQQPTE